MKSTQDSYEQLIAPVAPFRSDLKQIERDCKTGHFEEAALRFKKIASNIKSAHPYIDDDGKPCQDETIARNVFIEIAKIIDDRLQNVLFDWQYAAYRTALAKVRDARFVTQDLRI